MLVKKEFKSGRQNEPEFDLRISAIGNTDEKKKGTDAENNKREHRSNLAEFEDRKTILKESGIFFKKESTQKSPKKTKDDSKNCHDDLNLDFVRNSLLSPA